MVWQYWFRCRLCGEVYASLEPGLAVEDDVDNPFKVCWPDRVARIRTQYHECSQSEKGIADFAGFKASRI